jgi:uncharacterized protein YraI
MRQPFIASAAAALLTLAGTVSAETLATAAVDLNVRSGPGPQYPIVGVIGANSSATILGCIEDSQWCEVAFPGGEGWAYSAYLTAEYSGSPVVVTERWVDIGVPAVTYEGGGEAAVTGAVGGAVTGVLVGGPVGAAVGGAAGLAAGTVIDPPEQVRTYVSGDLGDPVYLDGEVVVGAQVPETVVLRPIPDYEYQYVYVNGVPVLVEPAQRRIIYVMR